MVLLIDIFFFSGLSYIPALSQNLTENKPIHFWEWINKTIMKRHFFHVKYLQCHWLGVVGFFFLMDLNHFSRLGCFCYNKNDNIPQLVKACSVIQWVKKHNIESECQQSIMYQLELSDGKKFSMCMEIAYHALTITIDDDFHVIQFFL